MKDFVEQIIKEAGELAKSYFKTGITFTTKSHPNDLVTEADVAVSDLLTKRILEKFPDHQITSEEAEVVNPGAQIEWLLDPIDGTRNFANGISWWCQIISIVKDGEPWIGAVYNPIGGEFFYAEAGHGATMNNIPINVAKKTSLDYTTAGFSCARAGYGPYGTHFARYCDLVTTLIREKNTWLHNFGCILDVCYLASGGFDYVVKNAGLDHDFVGPFLIAAEAGAKVTDSDGNPWRRGRQDVIMANPILHTEVMKLIK